MSEELKCTDCVYWTYLNKHKREGQCDAPIPNCLFETPIIHRVRPEYAFECEAYKEETK